MKSQSFFAYFLEILWRWLIKPPEDFCVMLGAEGQATALFAVIYSKELWNAEPLKNKLKCLCQRKWEPDQSMLRRAAKGTFINEIFGEKDDFGYELLELFTSHSCKKWDFNALNEHDLSRARAIEAFTLTTRQRLRKSKPTSPLNLQLGKRYPEICLLVYPMLIKIPVISFNWFLDIHVRFAFNEIRKSQHPHSNDLISYLYEILFLQQKIAIALDEYLRLQAYTEAQKGKALLINAETNTIMGADLVFTYLKASIEKTMSLVAVTHGILNLDSKKSHQARLRTLDSGLPAEIKATYYCQFIMEFIQSENLEELNNYRSGLLHKKGIADLQPHNYVDMKPESLPFYKIYDVLHEQHTKNTAALLASLALLADELMRHRS